MFNSEINDPFTLLWYTTRSDFKIWHFRELGLLWVQIFHNDNLSEWCGIHAINSMMCHKIRVTCVTWIRTNDITQGTRNECHVSPEISWQVVFDTSSDKSSEKGLRHFGTSGLQDSESLSFHLLFSSKLTKVEPSYLKALDYPLGAVRINFRLRESETFSTFTT